MRSENTSSGEKETKGIFEASMLTSEQMAGQRLMAGFDGADLNDDVKYLIEKLRVGGLILFARNIESPGQLTDFCGSVREFANSCGQPKLFLAIDQEGGTVARLKRPFTEFPKGAPGIKTIEEAVFFAETTAREMKGCGLNMNMAPVLDIDFTHVDSIMKTRAYGNDSESVSRLGCAIIETFLKNGIIPVAKHFPGIGRTTLDSHLHLPVLETPLKEMMESDLVPFSEAIERGVPGIMLSHIHYKGIDPDIQASLSSRIADELLRKKMGFSGITLTDDMDMKAIKKGICEAVRPVMEAGIDLTLVCHKSQRREDAFREMVSWIKEKQENHKSCQKSVQRILKLKKSLL